MKRSEQCVLKSILLKEIVRFGIFIMNNMQDDSHRQEGMLMKRAEQVSKCIIEVYHALQRESYNPAGQLTGYLISGDATYITSKGDARKKIQRIEAYEILEVLLESYFEKKNEIVGGGGV